MRVTLKPAGLALLGLTILVLAGIVITDAVKDQKAKKALESTGKVIPPNPTSIPLAPLTQFIPTADRVPVDWQYSLTAPAKGWTRPGFDATKWRVGKPGFGNQQAGIMMTPWMSPDIWLRRSVTLPKELPVQMTFQVFHDEDIEIYVNGVLAAKAEGYSTGYVALPMNKEGYAALKAGEENIIAVHCHNKSGGQKVDVGL